MKSAVLQPLRKPRKSLSSSDTSEASDKSISVSNDEENWSILHKNIMYLNEKNYATYSKSIITQLQNIIGGNMSSSSNSSAVMILYILYERSMRELLTKSFPVSANLVDTLTSGCSEEILEIIQPLIQQHLKLLQKKLLNATVLKGVDIGVLCLLLNMYKLEKMASRRPSAIVNIIEQVTKDSLDYLEQSCINKNICTDVLIMLLFCLIRYSLQSGSDTDDFQVIKSFARKNLVRNAGLLTTLGKVMAIDIVEQMKKQR